MDIKHPDDVACIYACAVKVRSRNWNHSVPFRRIVRPYFVSARIRIKATAVQFSSVKLVDSRSQTFNMEGDSGALLNNGSMKCLKCTYNALSKETTSLKVSFFASVEVLIKTLVSSMSDPEKIISALPQEIANQLRAAKASTIQDIFKEEGPLDKALNWYDTRLLKMMINKFGDTKCRTELEKYEIRLTNYLRSRSRRVFSKAKNEKLIDEAITLLVDREWEEELMSDSNKQEYITSLLQMKGYKIQFVQLNIHPPIPHTSVSQAPIVLQ